jgi:hypothetical protein
MRPDKYYYNISVKEYIETDSIYNHSLNNRLRKLFEEKGLTNLSQSINGYSGIFDNTQIDLYFVPDSYLHVCLRVVDGGIIGYYCCDQSYGLTECFQDKLPSFAVSV